MTCGGQITREDFVYYSVRNGSMKNNAMKKLLLGGFGLMICAQLMGCSREDQKPALLNSVNVAGILADKSMSPSSQGEQLAQAAEQLLTMQGFVYANSTADLALTADPSNVRAKFVKAILAPIMAQQGVYARLEPLASLDPKLRNEYDRGIAEAEVNFPNSTMKSFFYEGSPDIKTEADVQAYLDSITDGFAAIRKFARQNKGQSLTIMASDTIGQMLSQRWGESCVWNEISPWNYQFVCPSPVHMFEVSFDRGDFEVMQQTAAGYELYFSLLNSYDLTGSIQVALDHRNDPVKASAQDLLAELLKHDKFGNLRPSNGLKHIKEMGIDAVAGMRWVLANRDTLCPLGKNDVRNRMGALINRGICIDQRSAVEGSRALIQADRILGGQTFPVSFVSSNGAIYSTEVLPLAALEAPLANLHSLTPLIWNKCNQLVQVADLTLAGIFPKGDVNYVMQWTETCR